MVINVAWIKAPLEKKLSIKMKHINGVSMASQIQSSVAPTEQEGDNAVENAEDKVATGMFSLVSRKQLLLLKPNSKENVSMLFGPPIFEVEYF